ncbi:3-oxoadipyl-CoA thiolase [Thauera sp. CAU 1555]|uniref:acetyl-CoA C-acyltransferase n=1 Tax=Thauera sedimentorum TaxID=2767595 RepID=A0ABR9B7L9_9RHOO|nr:3-oxoadipyl-CoA thiolase [Thauera sedimentorum]MBC9071448.1 3-oxoadipyl-CoA thiolase [Thauera sedimentorum]MBD8502367.1 3-oxoadipyl-CoA thiolase [Thauera sedimentorum]
MLNAYIYGGLRSPFGRHGGALAPVRPDDLAAVVITELIQRSGFDPAQIEDVVLGCAAQSGEDSRNVARHAALLAGLPATVPGQTVNRLCGSGLAAVLDCARAVSSGEGALYVAGGVESMSRAPFVIGKAEAAWSREFKVFDSTIGARFPNPELVARYGNHTMPETADIVATELGIARAESDRFALASQTRYAKARADGFFAGELLPLAVPNGRKQPPRQVAEDEHPRPDATLDSLAALKPLHGGVVTAGNASGLNDGAAAVLIGNLKAGERAGVEPQARILAGAVAGVEPRVMGLGPAHAIPKALERAGLRLADMDVIEINEAFAPQVLGCLKQLAVAFDDPRVNPNGGAIAVGHPLGASGARIALSAVRELRRRGGRYAVLSLCIGVGQGIAVVIERC